MYSVFLLWETETKLLTFVASPTQWDEFHPPQLVDLRSLSRKTPCGESYTNLASSWETRADFTNVFSCAQHFAQRCRLVLLAKRRVRDVESHRSRSGGH